MFGQAKAGLSDDSFFFFKYVSKRQIFLLCVRGGFSEEAINPAKILSIKHSGLV